uniref:Uncharacterized protein n=1 Tax=Lepeophtheirus salmonis TaxID=72036 RepID=A0A0K2TNY6_LEPSM
MVKKIVTVDLLGISWTWWMIINIRSSRIGSYKRKEWKKQLPWTALSLTFLKISHV